MNTLLEVKSLSYTPPAGFIFPGSRNDEILRNISFTINKGSITGIAGESGSGKTTLAKILAGILPPSSGSIVFNISPKWKKVKTSPVQILFQNNGGILNPFRTIFDAVKEIYEIRNGKNPESINKVKEIMDLVNLPESLYNNKGFQLSGGEQQRAAIAKVIAAKPGLLILDEPFPHRTRNPGLTCLTFLKELMKTMM
jgi:peptide/nickel transport system ATP-binding protein